MVRLKPLSTSTATGKTAELYTAIKSQLGMVPNMMQTMGNSPAFLEGYLGLSGALAKGTLGAKTGALIALAVAQSNGCDYCLSAHTYIGANLIKIDAGEMDAARDGRSTDPRIHAVLVFAKAIVARRGNVSDEDVAKLISAGITEGEVGEIIGHVALNILTNYFNTAAGTEIDFPVINAIQTAAV